MNQLDATRRTQVIRCLVEGSSIRSTVRMTGVAKNTVAKLLVELGAACAVYQDEAMRNLKLQGIQCNENWSFAGAKDKNVPQEKRGEFGIGSVWTWTAIDAETKLVPRWLVGTRDAGCATAFMQDLAGRLASHVQLTTDGYKCYLAAVPDAFGEEIDYSMLTKVYGNSPESEKRYSPAICLGGKKEAKIGDPDPAHTSTSYVERQNLTMRMSMRRFTRLTNGISKKLENHIAALAVYFMYYNFARIHRTLRVTPAMAAGVTNQLWDVSDIVALLDKNSN